VSYEVKAEPAVNDDLAELAAEDRDVAREALRLMLALRDDPWLGDELHERYNLRPLRDCRRIRFDRPDWEGKPRYRLVYRNEPSDGAPGRRVGAVAHSAAQRAGGVRLRDEHSTGNCGGKSAVGGDERYLECLREHGIEGVVRR